MVLRVLNPILEVPKLGEPPRAHLGKISNPVIYSIMSLLSDCVLVVLFDEPNKEKFDQSLEDLLYSSRYLSKVFQ